MCAHSLVLNPPNMPFFPTHTSFKDVVYFTNVRTNKTIIATGKGKVVALPDLHYPFPDAALWLEDTTPDSPSAYRALNSGAFLGAEKDKVVLSEDPTIWFVETAGEHAGRTTYRVWLGDKGNKLAYIEPAGSKDESTVFLREKKGGDEELWYVPN